MRAANGRINRFRIRHGNYASTDALGTTGAFRIPAPQKDGSVLAVLASQGGGWDHVSVSLPGRCPTWEEMCFVRGLFFADDEWVVQFHPPAAQNISYHDFCLHLWRPQTQAERDALSDDEPGYPTPGAMPLPPASFVGPAATRPSEQAPCPAS